MSELSRSVWLMRKLRTPLVYLLIFVLLGFIANQWMTRDQLQGKVPALMLQDLNGDTLALDSSSRASAGAGPRVLYFFAEWCPVCKLQNPVISALADDYEVIGVSMQSGEDERVREYLAQQGMEMRVINDEYGEISHSFGVNGVPSVFIVDRSGSIQYSTRGYATGAGLRSRLWLAARN